MSLQAQKGGGGIGLPILHPGTRMRVDGQHHVSALPGGKKPCTYCTGGWVGIRVSLDKSEKSRHPLGFEPWTIQPISIRYTTFLRTMRKSTKWFIVLMKFFEFCD